MVMQDRLYNLRNRLTIIFLEIRVDCILYDMVDLVQ